ncbi:MAG: hypothetical protein WC073_02880 [Sterolibacterium sp.]
MKSPKLLPWLANTSGLSQVRVEQLWQDASQYAANVSGEVGTSDYWSTAHQQLISLVEEEALARQPVESAPWLMAATHISMVLLVVADVLPQIFANVHAWFTEVNHRPA